MEAGIVWIAFSSGSLLFFNTHSSSFLTNKYGLFCSSCPIGGLYQVLDCLSFKY